MRRSAEPSPKPADHAQQDLTAWSLLAGLLLLVALAGPFFAGRCCTRDDLGAYHLPVRAFFAQQLARGEPFDWMPQLYSGFYLTGEGQGGTYHPWHLLLYRCLPLQAALAWEWLGTYPFLLLGTWLFLRRLLGRRDAAMLGSLLFTFCSFNVLHFIHPNAVAVIAHIPWLLWAIDIVLCDSSRRKVACAQAAIGLLTGSQLLLGYPQYIWFSLLAESGYAALLLYSRRHSARRGCEARTSCAECVGCARQTWPRVVLAKAAGLLLGGVQLWPTLDALAHSTRQTADAAFALTGSVHPANLIQLIAPYLFTDRVLGGSTHETSLYVGAVPLLLVVWLIIQRRHLGPLAPLARATAWFAVLALVLAMGQYGCLYQLQRFLPLVNRFRCPCRYLVLFQLCVALLAAIGFILLERSYQQSRGGAKDKVNPLYPDAARRNHIPWSKFEGLWAVVVVSGAAALTGLLTQHRPLIAAVPKVLAGPLLFTVAALLVIAAARGARGALVALILLAAADLGVYGMSYSVYEQTSRLDVAAAAAVMPPADLGGRVLAPPQPCEGAGRLWTGNQMILTGWQRADGYTGLEPQRQLDYASLPALQVAATSWVQRDPLTAQIAGLLPQGDQWLQVPGTLPYIRLVTHVLPSEDPAHDIRQIDIRTTALTEHPLALPSATPGTVTVVAKRPGRMELDVDAATEQLLVVSESYHVGWQALVDGAARPVLRVNGDFFGCLVGPGRQRVVLEFRPESLRRGWFASAAGLGLISIFLTVGLVRFKRRLPEEDVS